MTLVEKKSREVSGGPTGWEGMSELGHCWAVLAGTLALFSSCGEGTWGTPRSSSLGKSFTHLGLVFSLLG